MAAFNEVSSSGYTNVATVVGCEVANLVRNGTTVSFDYRAYIYQSTNTYSYNAFGLWVEGVQHNVKGSGSPSSQWTRYYTPWYHKDISLGTDVSTWGTSIGVNGNASNPSSPAGYVYPTLSDIPTIYAPALSNISVGSISDTSVYASFNVTNNNGQAPYSPYIDVATANFSGIVKTISARAGTLSGLTPNRTYYVRGNDANDAGRSYTNVAQFKTSFVNPGNPGKPALTYDQTEVIPRAKITASWSAASAGSTAVAGYRIRLFKNNVEVFSVDTENTNLSYTFNSLESYGFAVGDKVKVGIYSYSKDWKGTKFFNGGGASSSQIFSNELTVVSDKYIYASVNGAAFNKYKMYVSVNGGGFKEVKKEKFRII